MALSATPYKVDINLTDLDRGVMKRCALPWRVTRRKRKSV